MKPLGIKIISAASILAGLALLSLSLGVTGGKLVLFLCVAGLHFLLGAGIYFEKRWSIVITLIYALLQAVGMSVWSLISTLTLMADPITPEKIKFFIATGCVVPFLIWAIVYLIQQLKRT